MTSEGKWCHKAENNVHSPRRCTATTWETKPTWVAGKRFLGVLISHSCLEPQKDFPNIPQTLWCVKLQHFPFNYNKVCEHCDIGSWTLERNLNTCSSKVFWISWSIVYSTEQFCFLGPKIWNPNIRNLQWGAANAHIREARQLMIHPIVTNVLLVDLIITALNFSFFHFVSADIYKQIFCCRKKIDYCHVWPVSGAELLLTQDEWSLGTNRRSE